MNGHHDNSLPELLVTLAADLRAALKRLEPSLQDGQLNTIMTEMMRSRAWGRRLRRLPYVEDQDLPHADAIYAALYDDWDSVFRTHINLPQQWRRVAICSLLGVTRQLLGGLYVQKGAPDRAERNRQMLAKFRGDYDELGLEFGLTGIRVRQIIDPMLAAERRRRQRDLFDEF